MKIRPDTLIVSFVVALFSSFLTALAVILVKTAAISFISSSLIVNLILNIYVLFFFAGFVFFKGSSLAAWMLYRHDVTWGYKLEFGRVLPIFVISFIMATSIFFAVYFYITSEVRVLAFLG